MKRHHYKSIFCIIFVAYVFASLFFTEPANAATFTAAASGNWNVGTTWGGACASSCVAGTDYPGAADVVTIGSSKTVTLTQAEAATTLNLNSTGVLDLSNFTLTVSGTATLATGGTLNSNAGSLVAGSPLISGVAVGGSGSITIEKTGSTQSLGTGGSVFSNTATIKNTGTGALLLANTSGDTFSGDVTFTNTNSGGIQPARGFGSPGNNAFNGNIIVESTGSGGVLFGQGSGSSTLAALKTITVGGGGFSSGTLNLSRITQTGATDQTLALTGGSLTIGTSAAFGGGLTVTGTGTGLVTLGPTFTISGNANITAPRLMLNGVSLTGTGYFEKTGATQDGGLGGNTFGSATTIKNSGSGNLILANTSADTFNGDVTFSNTSTGGIWPARGFSGGGNTAFNGNIIVESTGSGGIVFANGGTGTSTLATSKTITVGGGGFSSGTLSLSRFTQTGATDQVLALTGGSLTISTSSAFGGGLTASTTGTTATFALSSLTISGAASFIAPQLSFTTTNFNSTAYLERSGASQDASAGGNTFASSTTIKNTGTGLLILANSSADTFNGNVTFTNTNSGGIWPSRGFSGGGNSAYNGNIIVESTGSGGITFGGNASGLSTLASTKTIAVGAAGFSSGTLTLQRFTQTGATNQTLALTGGNLVANTNTSFEGGLTVTNTGTGLATLGPTLTISGAASIASPQVLLNGTVFNGTATIQKTGATANQSNGGNTFASTTSIKNSGSGALTLAGSSADTYNGDTTLTNTSTGGVVAAKVGANAFNGNLIVESTDTGGISFGTSTGTATLASGKAISIGSTNGFSSGTLALTKFTQTGSTVQSMTLTGTSILAFGSSSTWNGNVTAISPRLQLNGTTFNAAATLEKNGTSSDTSTGANTFNGTTIITTSGSGGTLTLGNTTGDTFADNLQLVQADGTLTISSVGTTTFSKGSGTQTLDAGGLTIPKLTHSGAGILQLITNPLTVSSALTNSAGTFDENGIALILTGNYTNSATFTAGSGTVTLAGLSQQTLSGTMTGSSGFYNLTITNHSGTLPSDDERTGFIPSIDFAAGATATGTFTIVTASVGLEFESGSTYTFNNINWDGQSNNSRIRLRNSSTSGTWLLDVSGTQTVSHVNVSRSNASLGDEINATDGTNYDGSNNTNWNFGSGSPTPTPTPSATPTPTPAATPTPTPPPSVVGLPFLETPTPSPFLTMSPTPTPPTVSGTPIPGSSGGDTGSTTGGISGGSTWTTTGLWTLCAHEDQMCLFEGTAQVRYGKDEVYYYRTAINELDCANMIFEDPVALTVKDCWVYKSNTMPPAAPAMFERDLVTGSSGPDVRELQQLLNAQGFPVAINGPGSPGHETTLFDRNVWRALIKFQRAHGLSGSGNFLALTRAVANSLLGSL